MPTALPYGEHPHDCNFTIGHATYMDKTEAYGIIWYSGGEAWIWPTFDSALASARKQSERYEADKAYRLAKSR
ncbi:hypothetical protein UFOVP785_99 [uncultured Caudovirales phage]|uniref:Uncharacterized protein n=1 Tax=uncultured Caudovirales phage TaxID=2100421 RepID=A0A6J5NVB3_9CAUD|nr:hypothetical protein UFOVP785_99 [uncultured Caudovirales phage]